MVIHYINSTVIINECYKICFPFVSCLSYGSIYISVQNLLVTSFVVVNSLASSFTSCISMHIKQDILFNNNTNYAIQTIINVCTIFVKYNPVIFIKYTIKTSKVLSLIRLIVNVLHYYFYHFTIDIKIINAITSVLI